MVVIKGMSMPESCHWDCPLCNEDGGECMLGSYDPKTDTTKERAIKKFKRLYNYNDKIMSTCVKEVHFNKLKIAILTSY